MKINRLIINGFGKIENKEINLNDNLNIIHGENEAGKSTILRFIPAMIYGIPKSKSTREITTIEKFKPWSGTEYSGKLNYELDNGEKFEVFRDFSKRAPKIYNNNGEDISKEFSTDKTKGNDFFFEQTKIDEGLFNSTTLVEQQGVTLDEKGESLLIQKLTNIIATGEDNISYTKAMNKLDKIALEKVGTERSSGRPLNIINDKIERLKIEKKSFENNSDNLENIDSEILRLQNNADEKEINIKIIRDVKSENDKLNIEKEQIKIKEQIKNETESKIVDHDTSKVEEKSNKKGKAKFIIFSVIEIICIALLFFNFSKIITIALATITLICAILTIIFIIKEKNNKKEFERKNKKIKYEIELLQENVETIDKEIKKLTENLNQKEKLNKEILIKKYSNVKPIEDIENLMDQEFSDSEINALNDEINSIKFKIHTLKTEKESAQKNIDRKASIDEEYDSLTEQKEELQSLAKTINLAKEALDRAYSKAKKEITPKFTEELSKVSASISNNKYKKCNFTDENGLVVEKENGEYISVKMLSTGTIDQMYLGLRLSIMNEISMEKMPIILDEAFAYYDDKRLENILRYLIENYKDNQIIIFTCSNREQEILNKINEKFNLIEI